MDCPDSPTKYGEFSRRLHSKVADLHIPITGSIEITERCNLNCGHCYINKSVDEHRIQEFSFGDWRLILDQIADQGCLWLLITGGEPLIHPDFIDIFTYAKKKGFLITLFTNATLCTPALANHLAEWPPFSVEISLYGRTMETYERVTGVSGSFARCMKGIELLMERKLPLKLKSMVTNLNFHEVWDMKTFAEGLGLDYRFDALLNLRLDGDRRPAEFRIKPEEVVALDLADDERLKGWREFCDKFWGPPSMPDTLYHCGAGNGTFHIDSRGFLSVCAMSRVPAFDLSQDTFHRGWNEFIPQVLGRMRTRTTPCQSCDLISLCGQCPGWAQLEHGDQERPVEYLCRIAHRRARALRLAVAETEPWIDGFGQEAGKSVRCNTEEKVF